MKAAKTRALHKQAHHGGAGARKPARKAKAAPKAVKAKKAPVKRTAAQVKAAHQRAWSPGDVSCCSAEAVAASLRLAGRLVDPAEVLALYRRTADGPGDGASLLVTLEAAAESGLAGVRPARFGPVDPDEILAALSPVPAALTCRAFSAPLRATRPGHRQYCDAVQAPQRITAYVLGLDMPEAPHAVCLDLSGAVWSWGRLHDLTADAVIEEAWAIEWLIPPALCAPESS